MKNIKKILSAALAIGILATISPLPQALAEQNNTSGVATVTDSSVTKDIKWSDYKTNGFALINGTQIATIPNFYKKGIAVVQGGVPQNNIQTVKSNVVSNGLASAQNLADAFPLIVGSDETAFVNNGNNLNGNTIKDVYSINDSTEYLHIGGGAYGNKYKVGATDKGGNWAGNGFSPIIAVESYDNNGIEYNPVYMSGSVSALNNIVKGTVNAPTARTNSTVDGKPVIFFATHTAGAYQGNNTSKNILGFQCYVAQSATGTPVLQIDSVISYSYNTTNVVTMGAPYDYFDGENYLYTMHLTNNVALANKLPYGNATVTVDVTSGYTPVIAYNGNLTAEQILAELNREQSIKNVNNFVDYKIYYKQEKLGAAFTYAPYAELTLKFTTSENKEAKLTYTVSLNKAMNISSNYANGNTSTDKAHVVLKPFLGLSAFGVVTGNPQFHGSVRSVLFGDIKVGYEPIGDCVNGGATLAATTESADKQNIRYSFNIADKGQDTVYQYGVKSLYKDFTQSMLETGEPAAAEAATPITEKREIVGYGAAVVKGETATPAKIQKYVQKNGTKSIFGYALAGNEAAVKSLFASGVNTIASTDKVESEFSITITSSATDANIAKSTNMLPFIAYKVTDKDGKVSYTLSWAGNSSHYEKNGVKTDDIISAGMAKKSVFGLMKSIINNNENYQTDEQLTALLNKANKKGNTSYTLDQLKGYLAGSDTEAQKAIREIFFYGIQQVIKGGRYI